MRFSLITSTPNEMYAFNPFINTPAVVPLTMEAFIAPADFDPDAQELNIVKAFAAYPNANKKYIFSVGTSATTVLPAVGGRSYAYAENGGAYTTIASGTVTWTSGSTKRNVVVIDSGSSVIANIPVGGVWGYSSDKVYSFYSEGNTLLKYINCQKNNSITYIEVRAFNGCSGLTGALTIPNSITSIGTNAFYNCSRLTGALTIPNSITSIGTNAFYNCSGLTGALTIPNSITSIGTNAFYNCSGLTGALTIPNSVTSIGDGAFAYCSRLTGALTIPNSVTKIGDGAFYYCSGFTGALTIPDSVTKIGGSAFYYCSGFTGALTIPDSVTTIGGSAFRKCSGFTGSLTLPMYLTIMGAMVFSDCTGLTGTLTLPDSLVLTANCTSFFEKCNFDIIDISQANITNITSISRMFSSCSKLTNIIGIGNIDLTKCTDFGNYIDGSANNGAFNGCTNLTTLDLSSWRFSTTNPVYFQGVFFGCTNLTTIGDVASWNTEMFHKFEMCFANTKLKSLNTPNWNTSNLRRTYRAFFNCTKLETVDTTNWNTDLITDCSEMFSGCIVLTSSFHDSKWWNRPNPIPSYVLCFFNSTNIINYTDIPVSWK